MIGLSFSSSWVAERRDDERRRVKYMSERRHCEVALAIIIVVGDRHWSRGLTQSK